MDRTIAPTIAILSAGELEARLGEFGELLRACVEDGASIGFVLPFGQAESVAFWEQRVLPGVREESVVLLAALLDGRVAGSVQLGCDTMPNQRHRAEVRKLLVHPAFRRRGIARRLMAALETLAIRHGRTLLTLDTRTGDSAEPLYRSLGFRTVGVIPGYCRDTILERLDPTTIMYKQLGQPAHP